MLVHELMHLKRMDDSPKFWKLVSLACPEYRLARMWLRRREFLLRMDELVNEVHLTRGTRGAHVLTLIDSGGLDTAQYRHVRYRARRASRAPLIR